MGLGDVELRKVRYRSGNGREEVLGVGYTF